MSERIGLGDFEFLVLAAVLRLGDEAYGSAVYRQVEATGRRVSMGAVYTTLYRLEERGLLRSCTGEPTPTRGGRAKRYFQIELEGLEALKSSVTALRTMLDGTELSLA